MLAKISVVSLFATATPAVAAPGHEGSSVKAETHSPADIEVVMQAPTENPTDDCDSEGWNCDDGWGDELQLVSPPKLPASGSFIAGSSFLPDIGEWHAAGEVSITWLLDGESFEQTSWDNHSGFKYVKEIRIPADAAGKRLEAELYATGKNSGSYYDYFDLGIVKILAFTSSPNPTISGTAQVGNQLKATTAAWNPAANFAYQWKRDGSNISGATKASYQVQPADAGRKITVAVTGTRQSHTPLTKVSAAVTPTTAAFSTSPAPKITGTAQVGKTLKANATAWSPSATFSYQWKRDGKNIKGATKASYQLVAADSGKKISVALTGTRSGYGSLTRDSSAVTVANAVFAKSPAPTIKGTAQVGKKLTASTGTWSPKAKFTYQWYRGNSKIKGATKSTYTPVGADLNKSLKVRIVGTASGYKSVTRDSKARKIAVGTISPGSKLTISGTARAGSTISASVKLPSGTKASYQWYKNGTKIKKATKKSYKLAAKDVGAKYQVRMTVTGTGYKKLSLSSNTVKISRPIFSVKKNPAISGTPTVGKTLKVKAGTYSPKPTSYSYQWVRNGKSIKGATKSSYKLVNADSGKSISVKVTAKKNGYDNKNATTKAVSVAKVLKTVINGNGTYRVGKDLKPGLYKANGAGNSCYWERLNGFGGSLSNVNANHFGSSNVYVRILAGDAGFKTSNCGAWTEVPAKGTNASKITKDGNYRVGIDIKPGLYKGKSSDTCYWETLRDFDGQLRSIIDNDFFFTGTFYVDIPSNAKGFGKSGCGTLTRVG